MVKIYHLNRVFPNHSLRPEDESTIENIVTSIKNRESMDIREIAKRNFSSPASISRLAKRAGFNNFKEMIFFLSKEFSTDQLAEVEALPYAHYNQKHEVAEELLTQAFTDKSSYLYGEGFCQFLVNYTYRKLLLKKSYPIDLNGVEISLVSDGLPHTLLIFSQSGENSRGLTKIQECKAAGGNVIAFTAAKASSFTEKSDLAFIVDGGPSKLSHENHSLNYFYGNCLNLVEYLVEKYS